jgi:hypothetical protein
MKKTIVYFALLFALVLVGCSTQQDEVLKIDENQQSSTFKLRSISEAIDIAKKATSLLPSSSRSTINVDEKNVFVIRSTTNSRSGEADTLLYAINNEGGEGFTLVSAPQNVEPIIAITENGSYGSVETEQNENFQYALSAAKDYVIEKLNSTKDTIIYSYNDSIVLSEPTIYESKSEHLNTPRVEVAWGQGWPYNLYAPNGVAGCVPVAIGQMMTYFRRPAKMYFSTGDLHSDDDVAIDWDDVKKHSRTQIAHIEGDTLTDEQLHYLYSHDSEETHKYIASIVRQIGVIAHSVYYDTDTIETSTYEDYAYDALLYYLGNSSDNTRGGDVHQLYNLLSNSGVALVGGTFLEEGTNKVRGHMWVADASGYVTFQKYFFAGSGIHTISLTTSNYIHYNWGWDGDCNGYFLEGIFATKDAYKNDSPLNDNTIDYDFNSYFYYYHIKQ